MCYISFWLNSFNRCHLATFICIWAFSNIHVEPKGKLENKEKNILNIWVMIFALKTIKPLKHRFGKDTDFFNMKLNRPKYHTAMCAMRGITCIMSGRNNSVSLVLTMQGGGECSGKCRKATNWRIFFFLTHHFMWLYIILGENWNALKSTDWWYIYVLIVTWSFGVSGGFLLQVTLFFSLILFTDECVTCRKEASHFFTREKVFWMSKCSYLQVFSLHIFYCSSLLPEVF